MKIEIICRVSGPWVRTKVESNPDSFIYRGLNKNPDLIFNGSKLSGNRTIENPFTSLAFILILFMIIVLRNSLATTILETTNLYGEKNKNHLIN